MWYALFAVTTSLAAMYELFVPALNEVELRNPENNIVEYRWLSLVTFFLLALLAAPLILPSCLVPGLSERFRSTLVESLS